MSHSPYMLHSPYMSHSPHMSHSPYMSHSNPLCHIARICHMARICHNARICHTARICHMKIKSKNTMTRICHIARICHSRFVTSRYQPRSHSSCLMVFILLLWTTRFLLQILSSYLASSFSAGDPLLVLYTLFKVRRIYLEPVWDRY